MATTATQEDFFSNDANYLNLSDDEARKVRKARLEQTEFRDLNLQFLNNPNTGDVAIKTGSNAVKQAIKNLILTDKFERPFNPGIGSRIKDLLFEPNDIITEKLIEDEITSVINNQEPRAQLLGVSVKSEREGFGYDVKIVFSVVNENEPVTFTTFLEATR